ncbi:preprotein translocase subunit SecE [Candidatus Peregrinibacteria bacterium]|nr:preprotein translocase subunit SecE [Candidatus Peregrinibacteria bacterium]
MNLVLNYVRESVEELHHVRWPTRQQAIRLSIVVVIFTFASSAVFGFLDFLLSEAVTLLLSIS